MATSDDSVVELVRTPVDLTGLLRVLAKNLYSTPEVAIRELVQNAHDSCVRRSIEDASPFDPRIVVTPDPTARTLTIEDDGGGLTRDEIDLCLATVGAGYTGKLRERAGNQALIGQFGIGFLSAYVVSSQVEVFTTSYQTPHESWVFASNSGERYHVRSQPPRPVGTRVVLHLNERFRMLCDPQVVEPLLRHYCGLLPTPIVFAKAGAASGSGERVNLEPPWRSASNAGAGDASDAHSPLRKRRDELAFATRFERNFEPICTIDVTTGVDAGNARGLLWIQDGASYGTSDNRRVSIFIRGMLVSDDARELLPSWAGFAGAVIEAEGLEPTASRESIQKNAMFDALAIRMKERLIEGLLAVSREEATWRRIVLRHNEALLGAALSDSRLFELLRGVLRVPTSEGEMTLAAAKRRSPKELYASTGEGGGDEILVRALGVPVIDGTRFAVLPFIRRALEREGGTLVELGTRKGQAELFPAAKIDGATTERLRALFSEPGVELRPTRFLPTSLPLVLATDRDAELKQRLEQDQADKRIGAAVLSLARSFTASIASTPPTRLYVNLDAPTITLLLSLEGEAATALANALRGLCSLMTRRDERTAAMSVTDALAHVSSALLTLATPATQSSTRE